jgi:hypothetical protein
VLNVPPTRVASSTLPAAGITCGIPLDPIVTPGSWAPIGLRVARGWLSCDRYWSRSRRPTTWGMLTLVGGGG